MTLQALRVRAATLRRLGIKNIARVTWYRVRLRAGVGPANIKVVEVAPGDFFGSPLVTAPQTVAALPAFNPVLFGWKPAPLRDDGFPDWFFDAFQSRRYAQTHVPWNRLPDFDPAQGDIKCIWELSRWDWVVRLSQHACLPGGQWALSKLNLWLRDWIEKNPAYIGPNWKCGQEASIRVLHLALAAHILGRDESADGPLLQLIALHLNRIAPTVGYALAQNNNHGTSEAAALFVGSSWLQLAGHRRKNSARLGRRLLENCVRRLIMDDGTFSQYSVNYHRLALDSLSFAELWCRVNNLEPFSQAFYDRAQLATKWLQSVVQPESGEAPIIGANDGARILPTTGGYSDYRPSVQLAASLFLNARAYGAGDFNDHLAWLRVQVPLTYAPEPRSRLFERGGLVVLMHEESRAYIRFPRFQFRPGHADALHVDLWYRGAALLSDGGTYSYNADGVSGDQLAGSASHNTVTFDDRDQMPRLSRFLYGAWLEERERRAIEVKSDGRLVWSGSYRDWLGGEHRRHVELNSKQLIVTDDVAGFERNAVLRWRLPEGNWVIENSRVSNGVFALEFEASVKANRLEIKPGVLSKYYFSKVAVPVVELEVREPARIVTKVSWGA